MTTQIIKTMASYTNSGWVIDATKGECPCIHVIEDIGNELMQIAYFDVIDKKNRRVNIQIVELLKPAGASDFYEYKSGLYKEQCIIVDDTRYCLIAGDGSDVDYATSHNLDGTFKTGYCSIYDFYKENVLKKSIFIQELNYMYYKN
jgi:hypothetical protein